MTAPALASEPASAPAPAPRKETGRTTAGRAGPLSSRWPVDGRHGADLRFQGTATRNRSSCRTEPAARTVARRRHTSARSGRPSPTGRRPPPICREARSRSKVRREDPGRTLDARATTPRRSRRRRRDRQAHCESSGSIPPSGDNVDSTRAGPACDVGLAVHPPQGDVWFETIVRAVPPPGPVSRGRKGRPRDTFIMASRRAGRESDRVGSGFRCETRNRVRSRAHRSRRVYLFRMNPNRPRLASRPCLRSKTRLHEKTESRRRAGRPEETALREKTGLRGTARLHPKIRRVGNHPVRRNAGGSGCLRTKTRPRRSAVAGPLRRAWLSCGRAILTGLAPAPVFAIAAESSIEDSIGRIRDGPLVRPGVWSRPTGGPSGGEVPTWTGLGMMLVADAFRVVRGHGSSTRGSSAKPTGRGSPS